jgi:hypothetical protein
MLAVAVSSSCDNVVGLHFHPSGDNPRKREQNEIMGWFLNFTVTQLVLSNVKKRIGIKEAEFKVSAVYETGGTVESVLLPCKTLK